MPLCHLCSPMGFPGSLDGKGSACYAGYPGLIPGLGRSPGKRNDHPLQYSCLETSMDRGACRAAVLGVAKSRHDWETNTFAFLYSGKVELCWHVTLAGVGEGRSMKLCQSSPSEMWYNPHNSLLFSKWNFFLRLWNLRLPCRHLQLVWGGRVMSLFLPVFSKAQI